MRVGMCGGGGVERVLERGQQSVVGSLVRARRPGRRHESAAKFADNSFPRLRVVANTTGVPALENETARPGPRVVAAGAVSIDEHPLRGRGRAGLTGDR